MLSLSLPLLSLSLGVNIELLSWRSLGDGTFSRSVSVFNGTVVALGAQTSVTAASSSSSVIEGISGLLATSQDAPVAVEWQRVVEVTVGNYNRAGAGAAIMSTSTGGVAPQHLVYVVGSVDREYEGRKADAFVAKYDRIAEDAAGIHAVWSEPFGTIEDDRATDVVLAAGGKVWVVGGTRGTFDGAVAYAPEVLDEDTFACRFLYTGALELCSQFGVSGDDVAVAIVALPTPQLGRIAQDVLILRKYRSAWKEDGELLRVDGVSGVQQWRKQFGTPAEDVPIAMVAGKSASGGDRAFVAGTTGGSMHGAMSGGGTDAFLFAVDVTSLTSSPTTLWSVQIGGAADEVATATALDALGTSVFIVGTTEGIVSPTSVRSGPGGLRDAWVAKVVAATGKVEWIHQFGSSGEDVGATLLVSSAAMNDHIAVVGHTHFVGQSSADVDKSWVAVLGAPLTPTAGGGGGGGGDAPFTPNATQACGMCDYCLQIGGAHAEIGNCRPFTASMCMQLAPFYVWCGAAPAPTPARTPAPQTSAPAAMPTYAPTAAPPTIPTQSPTPFPTALLGSNCNGDVRVPANQLTAALLLGEDKYIATLKAAFTYAGGAMSLITGLRLAGPVSTDSDGAVRVRYGLHNAADPNNLGTSTEILLRSVTTDVLCLPLTSAVLEGTDTSSSSEMVATIAIFGCLPAFTISGRASASHHTMASRAGDALFIKTEPPQPLLPPSNYWAATLDHAAHVWWRVDFVAPLNNIVLEFRFAAVRGAVADADAWSIRGNDALNAWSFLSTMSATCAASSSSVADDAIQTIFPQTTTALTAVLLEFAPSAACRTDSVIAIERVEIKASPHEERSGPSLCRVPLQVLAYASSAKTEFSAALALALPLANPIGASSAELIARQWDVPHFQSDLLHRYWASRVYDGTPVSFWLELATVATHVTVSFSWSSIAGNSDTSVAAPSMYSVFVSKTSAFDAADELNVLGRAESCAEVEGTAQEEVVATAPPMEVKFISIRISHSCHPTGLVAIAALRVEGCPVQIAHRSVPSPLAALNVEQIEGSDSVRLTWRTANLAPTPPLSGFTIWEQKHLQGAALVALADTVEHYTPRVLRFEPEPRIGSGALEWRTSGDVKLSIVLDGIHTGYSFRWHVQAINALGRGAVSEVANWTTSAPGRASQHGGNHETVTTAVALTAAALTCVGVLCAAGLLGLCVSIVVVRLRQRTDFKRLVEDKDAMQDAQLEMTEVGKVSLESLSIHELALLFDYYQMCDVADIVRSIEMDGEALAAMATSGVLLANFAFEMADMASEDIADLNPGEFVRFVKRAAEEGVERRALHGTQATEEVQDTLAYGGGAFQLHHQSSESFSDDPSSPSESEPSPPGSSDDGEQPPPSPIDDDAALDAFLSAPSRSEDDSEQPPPSSIDDDDAALDAFLSDPPSSSAEGSTLRRVEPPPPALAFAVDAFQTADVKPPRDLAVGEEEALDVLRSDPPVRLKLGNGGSTDETPPLTPPTPPAVLKGGGAVEPEIPPPTFVVEARDSSANTKGAGAVAVSTLSDMHSKELERTHLHVQVQHTRKRSKLAERLAERRRRLQSSAKKTSTEAVLVNAAEIPTTLGDEVIAKALGTPKSPPAPPPLPPPTPPPVTDAKSVDGA